jgi:hypothetical protein
MPPTRLVPFTIIAAIAAAIAIAPTAFAAGTRYASPTGIGTECTSAEPCQIVDAVIAAGSGGEVILAPGDYAASGQLATASGVTIQGAAGRPRPRLLFDGSGLSLFNSTLRHVELVNVQAAPALHVYGSVVEQVVATGSAGYSATVVMRDGSTIRNSVVVASGPSSTAVQAIAAGGTNAGTYRNVTAIATGSGGVAIEAQAHVSSKAVVKLVNVIARGGPGGASFAMQTNGGAEATITASHTNWANYWTAGANAHFVDGGGNQGAPPAFVDAAAGDYREKPGSVTIDAGLDDPSSGALDLDGDPRRVGATDIGADEFVPAPTATTGLAGSVTSQSATLSGSLDARGAPSTYYFEYGDTTAYGRSTPATNAGSATSAVAASAWAGDLRPDTTYHYRIVAANAGGVTVGADHTFTTLPAPAVQLPAASPPASPPTPTAQPFAGVELVSRRLAYARRAIAVTLRCPPETVGRCSGRVRLTARPRPMGGRPLALGRSTLSIAPGRQARVRVSVSHAGRRLLSRAPRLRARAVTVARNAAGQSRTTVAAVTIRRRHR